jgi:hypothetical protein
MQVDHSVSSESTEQISLVDFVNPLMDWHTSTMKTKSGASSKPISQVRGLMIMQHSPLWPLQDN